MNAFSLFGSLIGAYRSDARARQLCNWAFILSVVFIIATVIVDFVGYVRQMPMPGYEWIAVYMDQSIPEIFGYGLTLATAILLLGCYGRFSVRMFVFWAVFFLFAVLDDAFFYHEYVGAILVERLNLPALHGLRAQDTGELLAWAIVAVALIVPFAWSLLERHPGTWAVFFTYSVVLAGFIVFGIGVDMLHEFFGGKVKRVLNWVEDGGELLVQSAAFTIALLLYRFEGSPFQGKSAGPSVAHSMDTRTAR
ncbi:hypothetical protein [Ostreiculturibacter nitratireducens]|uniref:hypothetical protein n=1 Tax=Ostreiculturibacter nitratireducens TaxID=3075226 RepID=UPI0031B5782F